MQIRPGSAPVSAHMQGKAKKGSERRGRYVHGILREKFEKSLSLRAHWLFHTDGGECRRQMKLDGWRTQQTEKERGAQRRESGLTQWLPVSSILLCFRRLSAGAMSVCDVRVCVCVCLGSGSAAVLCRLSPAPLHLYWIGVGVTSLLSSFSPLLPPLSSTSLISCTILCMGIKQP